MDDGNLDDQSTGAMNLEKTTIKNTVSANQVTSSNSTQISPQLNSCIIASKKLCRYFKIDGHCKYEGQCRFLHSDYINEANNKASPIQVSKAHQTDERIKIKKIKPTKKDDQKIDTDEQRTENKKKTVCKFFQNNGTCKFKEKCHYLHEINGISHDFSNDKGIEKKIKDSKPNNLLNEYNNANELHVKSCVYEDKKREKIKNCQFFSSPSGCKYDDDCRFVHYRCVNDASIVDSANNFNTMEKPEKKILICETELETQIEKYRNTNNEIKNIEKKCLFFKDGNCKNGINCQFKHLISESTIVKCNDKVKEGKYENKVNKEVKKVEKPERNKSKNKIADNSSMQVCSYFLEGFCRFKSKCKDLHHAVEEKQINPEKTVNKEAVDNKKVNEKTNCSKIPCRYDKLQEGCRNKKCKFFHPNERNLEENFLTESEFLRETELLQLEKRFRVADSFKLIQKQPTTIYIITVKPTDPDWEFVIKSFNLRVEFPKDYPRKMFEVSLEEDENFPSGFRGFLNEDLMIWQRQKLNTRVENELSFRPFLKWFDKNISTLFINAAVKVKVRKDGEKAGITLVPYTEILPSNKSLNINETVNQPIDIEKVDSMKNKNVASSNKINDIIISNASTTPKNDKSTKETIKQGTEIKLKNLQLSEEVGTLKIQYVQLTVECSRCKNNKDLKLTEKRSQSSFCEKCNQQQTAIYHSVLMHQHSPVAGYLHMNGFKPIELVILNSILVASCLQCSKDQAIKGMCYAEKKYIQCHNCHVKMDLCVDSTRFYYLQSAEIKNGRPTTVNLTKKKIPKDSMIRDGYSLPESGICKHYKKSFRWLRFPCCGKAYACDKCHDEKEDHEMELALKMICGHCAKEQNFTPSKPCIRCLHDLTKQHSTHWEGGKGCRNKVTMARSDKHKTSGLSKTVSKKKTALSKPKEKKSV